MLAETLTIDNTFVKQAHDIIIIGSGPVGVRAVYELCQLNPDTRIAIFGAEPWEPYNRIQLSALVAGEVKHASLYNSLDILHKPNINTFFNNPIIDINRYSKEVTDSQGITHSYKQLILATGSRPHIPNIEGIALKNIFTLRNLNDAQTLMSRSTRTRHTVVIGGGLLGLEAARAMQRFNTQVTVIEHSMWLLFRQLDQHAGSYLKYQLEQSGINIRLNSPVKRIIGDDKVAAVLLGNDEVIECDTLIIATGIEPNIELIRNSGIKIGRGIRVNNQLQTNDQNIFAIGECAEHNNQIYGLVSPGYEQAAVCAHRINGKQAQYLGSITATNLKVIDYPVFSMGNTGESARSRELAIFHDSGQHIYRKLIIINGRLQGAIAVGEMQGINRLREAIARKQRVWPWQIRRFKQHGYLWPDKTHDNICEWPATATVCNCTGVTRGQLSQAQQSGAESVIDLARITGASTVCGSCKPLLIDFANSESTPEPVKGSHLLLLSSLISILIALTIFSFPGMDYAASVQSISLDTFWRTSLFKQISGFGILVFALIISVLSIKKRTRKLHQLGDYADWRVAHTVIALLVIFILFAHTGFRFGDNLNLYLMLTFSSLLFTGAIAGIAIASEHQLSRQMSKRLRQFSTWSHILILWPLPALLGFHILKTYYF